MLSRRWRARLKCCSFPVGGGFFCLDRENSLVVYAFFGELIILYEAREGFFRARA